jgi:archaetidylinositol phosphate synthase
MVLDKYRDFGDKYIIPVAEKFVRQNPNTLTMISLVFAFLAGICFYFAGEVTVPSLLDPTIDWHILLLCASVCIFLNAVFDTIDGKVAKLTRRMTVKGDFLDHAIDRYADIFMIGGIMLSAYCNIYIGALALIAVMLTSYMGTQAQAVGCGRNYSGLLGRAERMIILIIVPLIQVPLSDYYPGGRAPWLWHFTALELAMIWFIIAGNITAIDRCIQTWKELTARERAGGAQ